MAAALGYLSVCNMDSVSFRLLSGTRCTAVPPRISGRESFLRAGGARHAAIRGETDLYACIRNDPNPGADDGVTFILSDLLTDSDWRAAVDLLLSRRRGDADSGALAGGARSPTEREAHLLRRGGERARVCPA